MRLLRGLRNKILVPIIVKIDKILVWARITRPKIIMYMDGGLCSQMNFWRNGEFYAESGFDVYYDLRWFKTCGKGIDGVSERKYELQILWPHIEVKTLPSWKLDFYKYFLPWPEVSCALPDAILINRSVYFKGYTNLQSKDGLRIFRKHFSLGNAAMNETMQLNQKKRYCGIHVRRGDLANVSTPIYPKVSDGYFIRAIEYVHQNESIDEYLLFSEDPEWLRENILPKVSVPCRIMIGNKGYEDLMLLAQCDVIISSQGSFGRTAALINQHCKLFIKNSKANQPSIYAEKEVYVE